MIVSIIISALAIILSTSTTAGEDSRTSATYMQEATAFEQVVQSDKAAPVISFDRMEYDFGKVIFKGQPKTANFKFKNTGNAPLVITRTELSCICLNVEYPRKPLMPGQEGTLTIKYTPKKETGKFNNTVKIYSNSGDGKPIILFLRVEVIK